MSRPPVVFIGLMVLALLAVAARQDAAAGQANVYVSLDGQCAGLTPCYTSVQGGLIHAASGNVLVFPGTYD